MIKSIFGLLLFCLWNVPSAYATNWKEFKSPDLRQVIDITGGESKICLPTVIDFKDVFIGEGNLKVSDKRTAKSLEVVPYLFSERIDEAQTQGGVQSGLSWNICRSSVNSRFINVFDTYLTFAEASRNNHYFDIPAKVCSWGISRIKRDYVNPLNEFSCLKSNMGGSNVYIGPNLSLANIFGNFDGFLRRIVSGDAQFQISNQKNYTNEAYGDAYGGGNENPKCPKCHILLGLEVFIGGLIAIIGLHFASYTDSKLDEGKIVTGLCYLMGGFFAVIFGIFLISGIGVMYFNPFVTY